MNIFKRLKIVFFFGPELEEIVRKLREKNKETIRESKRYNLNLCYKHRQEENHSHYSENNCDYCNLEKRMEHMSKCLEK